MLTPETLIPVEEQQIASRKQIEDNRFVGQSFSADALREIQLSTQVRLDGWKNVLSGMGTYADKRTHTHFESSSAELLFDKRTLVDMYAFDGLIQKIVDTFPDDMTRQWLNIPDDKRESPKAEGVIEKELKRLGAANAFNTALKWARLFGGSLIFVAAQDGGTIEAPLNIKKIKSIESLKVFDLGEIDTNNSEINDDIYSPNYGKIERFLIRPQMGYKLMDSFSIHHSRCIVFHGTQVPSSLMVKFGSMEIHYWGNSVVPPVWTYVRDLVSAMGATSQILSEFVIGKYKLSDLDTILAAGNEKLLQVRMQAIEMTKSILHAVLLGTDEDYTRDSTTLSGIPDALDRFMMFLSSVTSIPVTRLFGRSAAGLNATGENDLKNYYDAVKAKQENELSPLVSKLIEMICSVQKISPTPPFKWNPLIQLSEAEISENNRKTAEAYRTTANGDQLYVESGVIDPEYIRQLRFPDAEDLGFGGPTEINIPEEEPESEIEEESVEEPEPEKVE